MSRTALLKILSHIIRNLVVITSPIALAIWLMFGPGFTMDFGLNQLVQDQLIDWGLVQSKLTILGHVRLTRMDTTVIGTIMVGMAMVFFWFRPAGARAAQAETGNFDRAPTPYQRLRYSLLVAVGTIFLALFYYTIAIVTSVIALCAVVALAVMLLIGLTGCGAITKTAKRLIGKGHVIMV